MLDSPLYMVSAVAVCGFVGSKYFSNPSTQSYKLNVHKVINAVQFATEKVNTKLFIGENLERGDSYFKTIHDLAAVPSSSCKEQIQKLQSYCLSEITQNMLKDSVDGFISMSNAQAAAVVSDSINRVSWMFTTGIDMSKGLEAVIEASNQLLNSQQKRLIQVSDFYISECKDQIFSLPGELEQSFETLLSYVAGFSFMGAVIDDLYSEGNYTSVS